MAKKMSLPAQMGIGMVLGVIVGAMAPSMGFEAAWFKPIGDLFITLVRMVVVPLVFCTLIAGAAAVCDVKKLGRVATKTLVYYFATTTVAVAIGLVLAN
ncbi:MAG: dicarboxylate/amino acid:cation symporter, partial [Mailhella sp.]|nr:dicarboxylate/amino acid:cation symporter [Mailhella sp.]